MKRRKPLSRLLLIGFLLSGFITGIFARLYHLNHHRLTLFFAPEHVESYIDGECLNTAHPLPMHDPRLEVHLMQMLQRPHKAQFLQILQKAVVRDTGDYRIVYESPEFFYAGSEHFVPVSIDRETLHGNRFVLELDVALPNMMRVYLFNRDERGINVFGADFFAGSFAFALNDTWEWTQHYFVNDSMQRNLRNEFLIKVLSGIFLSIVLAASAAIITGIVLVLLAAVRRRIRKGSPSRCDRLVSPRSSVFPGHAVTLPEQRQRFRWEVFFVTMLAFAGAWLVSAKLFHHIPRVNDEAVYLFQAKVFASGRWFVPPPEPVECFKHLGIWWPDRVFSYYTYGHSMILTLGYLLGAVNIIPALTAAVAVLFTLLTGQKLYRSRCTGWMAGIFLIGSPLFMLLGGSFMSHTSSAAANMIFLFFLIRADTGRRTGDALVSGIALGTAAVIRPVTAAVFALFPLMLWIPRAVYRKDYRNVILLCLTAALVVSTLFAHAFFTTGSWEPIQKQVENRFETGNDAVTFWKNMLQNSTWFLIRGYGWIPYFTMMFAFLPFVLLTRNPWDYVFLCIFLLNAWLYSAIAHFGWTHEPRYWSECMPLIALLSARGIQQLSGVTKKCFKQRLAGTVTTIFGCAVAGSLFVGSLVFYWPYEVSAFSNYCNVRDDTYAEVLLNETPDSIFLFKGHPDYAYIPHFHRNRMPDFQGDVIYAMFHSKSAAEKLMNRYPDRKVFIVEDGQPVERIR